MKGILIDNDFDLIVEPKRDNDGKIIVGLLIGNSDYQNCHCITVAQKGEFKEYPTLGFGIDNYLNGTIIKNAQLFKTELQKELKTDNIDSDVSVSKDNKNFNIQIK